jgi:biopolymer transport protein ExbD
MTRKKRHPYESIDAPQLDISGMIDVCFLVLIYFIVAMTVIPEERDLFIGIPPLGKTNDDQSPISPIVVSIDGTGAVSSGENASKRLLDMDPASRDLPLLLSELEVYTSAARSAGDDPGVFLRVDENVGQQRFIDVLNVLAKLGIADVTFEDLLGS